MDAKTGDDVWQQKLPVPFFVFKWGPAMSPTLYKDKVLFVQDDDLFPTFYAFDRETGEILWTGDLGGLQGTANPMTYRSGGRQYVVVGVSTGAGADGGLVAFALPDGA